VKWATGRGDGAADTKCLDPNCRCQLTDLPKPNLTNSAMRQVPTDKQKEWRGRVKRPA
jgi:hypothetical protein